MWGEWGLNPESSPFPPTTRDIPSTPLFSATFPLKTRKCLCAEFCKRQEQEAKPSYSTLTGIEQWRVMPDGGDDTCKVTLRVVNV